MNSPSTKVNYASNLTAANPGFIKKYFESSRLHHLSTWKAELSEFTAEFMKKENAKQRSSGSLRYRPSKSADEYRTILHVDMDCFFVSVGLRNRPELRGLPIAVAHSSGTRGSSSSSSNMENSEDSFFSSSEIASCNYEAREKGVKNGMYLGGARKLAPELKTIPYEFEEYDKCSRQLYKIMLENGDFVQAVSCDEAYVDITFKIQKELSKKGVLINNHAKKIKTNNDFEHINDEQLNENNWKNDVTTSKSPEVMQEEIARQLAEDMRKDIFVVTGGCTASIGIGCNLLLSRMATKNAKPNGVFFSRSINDNKNIYTDLKISELPGVGYAMREKCDELGLSFCSDLRKMNLNLLKNKLGNKTAENLHNFSQGVDDRMLENKIRQMIGADINWGIRFQTQEKVELFLREFCEEVLSRLVKANRIAKQITINVKKRLYEGEPPKFLGCGHCADFSKTSTILIPQVKRPTEYEKSDSPLKTFETQNDFVMNAQQWEENVVLLYQVVSRMYKEIGVGPLDVRGVGIHLKKLEPPRVLNTFFKPNYNEHNKEIESNNDKLYKDDEDNTKFKYEKELKTNTKTNIKLFFTGDKIISPLKNENPKEETIINYNKEVNNVNNVSSFDNNNNKMGSQNWDSEVFAELPEDIRKELLQHSANTRIKTESKSRDISSKLLKPKEADNNKRKGIFQWLTSDNKDNVQNNKITKLLKRDTENKNLKNDFIPYSGMDEEVFNALPINIQKEQLAIWKNKKI